MNQSIQQALVSATLLSALACACSSSASGGSAAPGAGSGGAAGASAIGAPVGDGQAFVPSNILFNSVDADLSTQYKLLSATVRDYGDFIALLVSVRNDSGAFLCSPTFNAAFETATNVSGQVVVPLSSAMYLSTDGAAEPCLEPGAVGYGAGQASFDAPVQFSDITIIDYEPQGTLEPMPPSKITNVELSALAVSALPGGGQAIGGSLTNHGSKALHSVIVSYLALDSGGRPYDFDIASTDTPVDAGTTWAFTLPNISSLGRHGVFAEFNLGMP